MGLGSNYYLLPACWRYKPDFYFFSLHKIKMSKQQIIYPLNYISHIVLMTTNSKVFTFLSKSFHYPVPTLLVRIGDILAIFKINQ